MKTNLKNKPILLEPNCPHYWQTNVSDPDAVSQKFYELQKWFEDFEKELREYANQRLLGIEQGYISVKEVLGDS